MKRLAVIILCGSVLGPVVLGQTADTVSGTGGDIVVLPIGHGTLQLVHGQDVILVDPARFVPGQPEAPRDDLQALAKSYLARFGAPPPPTPPGEEPIAELLVSALPVRAEQMSRFQQLKPPTLILVTDLHTDHLDPPAIGALRGPGTRVIVPRAAAGRLLGLEGAESMANGDRLSVGSVSVEAIPMYNPAPDPQFGLFHPKGRGNGYVIDLAGKRVYVAGDTGCTPEVMALKGIDLAFIPMNVPYTMSPADAAACVRALRPKVVYPYHFFESDPALFAAALRGTGIEVRVRDWYKSVVTGSN
jgi:L-ascorbate metabolism protein UlaG (beta-lactamase superfamily)